MAVRFDQMVTMQPHIVHISSSFTHLEWCCPSRRCHPFLRVAPSPTLLGSTCLRSNASSHSPRQCCRSHWFRSIIVSASVDYYSTLGVSRSASNKEIKRNMDEAVEKLKKKGIEATGIVCHVSNPQQREEAH